MRTHKIKVQLTKEGTITLKIQADAGEIPDTICDTEMCRADAAELFEQLDRALDE